MDFQAHEEEIKSGARNDESLDKDNTIQLNEATRHLTLYNKSMEKIDELEGHTKLSTSSNDESITWKVVKEGTDDESKVAQERDKDLFKSEDFPIIQSMTYKEINKCDYKTGFWKLWPGTIEGDVTLINDLIQNENMQQKEKTSEVN